MEATFTHFADWGFVSAQFSRHFVPTEPTIGVDGAFYLAGNYDDDPRVVIPDDKLLGSAEKQVSLYGEYRFTKDISIKPSLIYMDERYTFEYVEFILGTTPRAIDSTVVTNLFVHHKNLFVNSHRLWFV